METESNDPFSIPDSKNRETKANRRSIASDQVSSNRSSKYKSPNVAHRQQSRQKAYVVTKPNYTGYTQERKPYAYSTRWLGEHSIAEQNDGIRSPRKSKLKILPSGKVVEVDDHGTYFG